jgi:GNAT superfamily N-acetyltransferase
VSARSFGDGLLVCRTRPEHAEQLGELQKLVFPTLAPEERFAAAHYLRHIELYPEGQFVVLDGDRVVGMTSTIRYDFDFEHPNHTFADVIQGGWLTSHQPDAPWLYGADIGTHPGYRRRGIAKALYAVRHDVVREHGLRGQMTVGMPSGYGAVKDTVTAEQYHLDLQTGARVDPTISAQVGIGFSIMQLLPNYLHDPVCDNYGIVLVLPADRDVPFPA